MPKPEKFTQKLQKITRALLVMLVTIIMSARGLHFSVGYQLAMAPHVGA